MCSHCKLLAPELEVVGAAFATQKEHVLVGRVDGEKETALVERFKITAFPTLLWFAKGDPKNYITYREPRDPATIISFIETQSGKTGASPLKRLLGLKSATFKRPAKLAVQLTAETFDRTVNDPNKLVFVEFLLPCTASRRNLTSARSQWTLQKV